MESIIEILKEHLKGKSLEHCIKFIEYLFNEANGSGNLVQINQRTLERQFFCSSVIRHKCIKLLKEFEIIEVTQFYSKRDKVAKSYRISNKYLSLEKQSTVTINSVPLEVKQVITEQEFFEESNKDCDNIKFRYKGFGEFIERCFTIEDKRIARSVWDILGIYTSEENFTKILIDKYQIDKEKCWYLYNRLIDKSKKIQVSSEFTM